MIIFRFSRSTIVRLLSRGFLCVLLAMGMLTMPPGIRAAEPDFDLELTLTAVTANTGASGFVPYVVQVTNHGPDTATDLKLTGYAILRGMPIGPEALSVPLLSSDPLPAGQTAVLGSIVMPAEPGLYQTQCSVSTPWPEQNMDNNSAMAEVMVAGPTGPQGNLVLTPVDTPTRGLYDQHLTFRFLVRNAGDQPVAAGYAGFLVPACGVVTNASVGRGEVTITERYCHVSNIALAPGEETFLDFTIWPTDTGAIPIFAGVSSELFDSNLGNNYFTTLVSLFKSPDDTVDLQINLSAKAKKSFKKKAGVWNITIKSKATYSKLNLKSPINYSKLIRYYLSDDAVADAGDIILKQYSVSYPAGLEPHKVALKLKFPWPTKSLQKYIIAVIDPDMQGYEYWTENNSAAIYLP